ncbi:hypothetical protein DTO021D3_8103 [Paecilomyces variotii]|nr:hypothetical protein DTO032I3_7665 [Paecilomyces variotii]KAJ9275028.1 hypothetical protein DTO021D3_8103 [Paecilomyces variotii]KAJ9342396.1 hypothetical protein DTO027B6_5119 [Paecilomyces variotii]KAJ9381286.1 hypothetical protein DTO032I4_6280 [Paecilomyces variotii]
MSMEASDGGTEANGTNKLTTKFIIPPRQRQERGVARDWDTNPREIQPRPPEFQRVRIGTRIAIHRPVRLYPCSYSYYDYDDSCKLQPSPHEQPGSPVDRDKPRLDPEDAQSPPASIRCDRYICRRQMERLARDCPELKQPGVGAFSRPRFASPGEHEKKALSAVVPGRIVILSEIEGGVDGEL